MRSVLGFVAAGVMLAGCSSEVPSPAERLEASTVAGETEEAGTITLSSEGLTAGGTKVIFSEERAKVEETLAAVLGDATDRQANGECGAGPMESTLFEGGLTANFQEGRFVGWFFDEANKSIALDGGITVGSSRKDVTAAPGYSAFEDSTLGEEFYVGDAIGGFLAEDAVSGLYSGTQCFFR